MFALGRDADEQRRSQADDRQAVTSHAGSDRSALLARAALGFPAGRDANRRGLFVRVAAEHAGNVGRKSLTDSRGAEDRESNASGDPGPAVGPTGQDLPPVTACGLALSFPLEHHPIDLFGDVDVRIAAKPNACIFVAQGGFDRHGTIVRILL
jgi:hypothetical protein